MLKRKPGPLPLRAQNYATLAVLPTDTDSSKGYGRNIEARRKVIMKLEQYS